MSATIYQIKITLEEMKPPIWRRVLVESNTLLPEMHVITQITMGWTDSHLHQFEHKRKLYSEPSDWDISDMID